MASRQHLWLVGLLVCVVVGTAREVGAGGVPVGIPTRVSAAALTTRRALQEAHLGTVGEVTASCNGTRLAEAAFSTLVKAYRSGAVKATTPFTPKGGRLQDSLQSLFVSMAYAHFNQTMAQEELQYLFGGQWDNGMLPHKRYFNASNAQLNGAFPPVEFWGKTKAADNVYTSGLATLPLHATAVLYNFYLASDGATALKFLQEVYPKIKKYHEFLDNERRLAGSDLLYVRHPDEALMGGASWWGDLMPPNGSIRCPDLPEVPQDVKDRADFAGIDVELQKLCVARCASATGYDEGVALSQCKMAVESVAFNAVWAKANRDLAEIALFVGAPASDVQRYRDWANKTSVTIATPTVGLVDSGGYFRDRSVSGARHFASATSITGTVALLAGSSPPTPYTVPEASISDNSHSASPSWEIFTLAKLLSEGYWRAPLLPSLDRYADKYSPNVGMTGPVWLRANYMVILSLRSSDFHGVADVLQNYTLSVLSCEALDETVLAFPEAFDSRARGGAEPVPTSASAMAAALAVLLVYPPGKPIAPTAVPVAWWGVLAVIVTELLLVALGGLGCVIISLTSLRNLGKEDQQMPRRQLPSNPSYASLQSEDVEQSVGAPDIPTQHAAAAGSQSPRFAPQLPRDNTDPSAGGWRGVLSFLWRADTSDMSLDEGDGRPSARRPLGVESDVVRM